MTLSAKREVVLGALFTKLQATSFTTQSGKIGFQTSSRRLKLWSDVPLDVRPAMFMTAHSESPTYRQENTTAYMKIGIQVFIYLDTKDKELVGDKDVSTILDAIDVALSPGPGEQRQTLGGLVSHCRVEGEVLRDPGDIDGDGIIIVPISVTLT